MSAAPIPALIDAVDSYYQWIKSQVLLINPNRKFGGIVEARDWPPKEIDDSALYLTILKDVPTRSPHQSFYAPLVSDVVAWRWAVQGNNIPQASQQANRGDRYRKNVQIIQEILSASNPGYCAKNQYSVQADVNNNPVLVATPYSNPPDYLWWTIPEITRKQDRVSSMVWTDAQVQVSSYAPIAQNAS